MTDWDRNRTPREQLGDAIGMLGEWRGRWYATPAVLAVTFLGLAVFPFVLDVNVFGLQLGAILSVHILVVGLIWAVAAQGWNIVSGFAGQFSFGHAAFFGLGAYAPLVLASEFAISPWLGLGAGSLIAGLYALCIGLLSFRYDIRGSYFALVTLAFAELLLYLFVNVDQLGGASGYVKPLPRTYGTDFGLAAFQFREALPYYFIVLGFLVVITLVAFAVKRSRVGLYLHAIRDDETAAAAVGIPTVRYKLFALVLSAMCTAWAGTAWSMYFTSIRPRVVFGVLVNLDILLPAVVGGIGTVVGPIVGSVVLMSLSEFARQAVGVPELQHVVYGILLLAIVLRSPGGITSWTGAVADRLQTPEENVRSGELGDD
jgi:branched-chain amino acid transport system permease protein